MNKYEIKYYLEQQTSAVDRLTDTNGKLTNHVEELWERNKSLQETVKMFFFWVPPSVIPRSTLQVMGDGDSRGKPAAQHSA